MPARRATGSKPRVDHEARREAYLRAAARAFLHKGLETATMQDVADEAGAPKVLVYRIFKSRQALLDALLERVLRAFHHAYAQPYTRYGLRVVQIAADAASCPEPFFLVLRYVRAGPSHGPWADALWDTLGGYVQDRWFTPGADVREGADQRARNAAHQMVGPVLDVLLDWIEGNDGLDEAARATWWQRVSREYHHSLRQAYDLGASPRPYDFDLVPS